MDVPTDLNDWWIFVIPGGLMLIETLFLYSGVTHAFPPLTAPKFNIIDVWNLSDTKIALLSLLIVVVGLVVGSVLEGVSYSFFERFGKKREIMLCGFQEMKRQKEKFVEQLLSDQKLFPADLWSGGFDKLENNIVAVSEFVEKQLLQEGTEDESATLNETAVAITFTQSFFLSFLLFPFIVFWLTIFEFTGIAIFFIVIYFVFLVYLWKDQRNLSQNYWKKTFDIFVSHLWKRKVGNIEALMKNSS